MKIDGFKVIESEFNGRKFKQLVVVIEGKEYLLGTLINKSFNDRDITYINCIHKEFKK